MMIQTERLILRRWREEDRAPFAAINADPEVMDWQGGVLTREISDSSIDRSNASFAAIGMGRWAIERRADGKLIGHCGMMPAHESLPIAGIPEIGWRLSRDAWGQGYATEAAIAVLADGFARLRLPEILAYTRPDNARSLAVMRRAGMHAEPARNFRPLDPPADDPGLRVVYALHAP